jgi:hypothetical protein
VQQRHAPTLAVDVDVERARMPGDVAGYGTAPIDVRRVTLDHHRLGDSERLTVTVRFADAVRRGSELNWGTSTRAGGYPLGFRWTRWLGRATISRHECG